MTANLKRFCRSSRDACKEKINVTLFAFPCIQEQLDPWRTNQVASSELHKTENKSCGLLGKPLHMPLSLWRTYFRSFLTGDNQTDRQIWKRSTAAYQIPAEMRKARSINSWRKIHPQAFYGCEQICRQQTPRVGSTGFQIMLCNPGSKHMFTYIMKNLERSHGSQYYSKFKIFEILEFLSSSENWEKVGYWQKFPKRVPKIARRRKDFWTEKDAIWK